MQLKPFMTSGGIGLLFAYLLCLTTSCSHGRQAKPSSLTPGAAKKHIRPGETTQAEVVECFGTPNVITRRDGGEMWVYDKVSSKQTNTTLGIAGLGGGGGSHGFGGGGVGGGIGSSERSETTVMLIVYFDEHDVVRDYKISQTKF